jgi:hypothetical protein
MQVFQGSYFFTPLLTTHHPVVLFLTEFIMISTQHVKNTVHNTCQMMYIEPHDTFPRLTCEMRRFPPTHVKA